MPVGKGAVREVFGLVTTLPHSAAHAAAFAFSKTVADFLPAFSATLLRLGGAPEKMAVDRDASIVVPRSRPARLHDEVAGLFGALRIRPVILGARKPQSKGQVERTVGYLETSFLPLRHFEDLDDLQSQHDEWVREVAFRRHHRRVGAKVADAWRVERGFLAPLPDPLPDTDRRTEVRVQKDGVLSHRRRRLFGAARPGRPPPRGAGVTGGGGHLLGRHRDRPSSPQLRARRRGAGTRPCPGAAARP